MRRLSLVLAAPYLALLTLAAGCSMDASQGLYEGDEAGDSASAGGTGSEDPSGGASGGASDGAGEGEGEGGGTQAGQLTAGEWRDLDHWSFWLELLQGESWAEVIGRWKFDTTQRYAVVVASDGVHVADASVTLLAGEQAVWTARTDVHGEAELFAGLFAAAPAGPLTLKVAVAGESVIVEDVAPASEEPIVIEVPTAALAVPVLDLMFMIDTTGSMDDELGYLQAELGDVIDRVRAGAEQGLK
ncbi:MAG: hypothetical protein H0T76_08665, partial [Nannocystis sp.]